MTTRIIVIGVRASGKTMMIKKIRALNPSIHFELVVDDIAIICKTLENLELPETINFIISAQTLDSVPRNLQKGALVLDVTLLRNL
jgi:Ni2+-binding GTPase involved in maturation of urease and hydrogenase